jgi:flotillin
MNMQLILIAGGAVAVVMVLAVLIAVCFRVVVSTNDVHIVQSAKRTVSYGKGQDAGNTYYKWPAWVPIIGVKTITLPVSVFDVHLKDYAGYDKGRVPFVIDIMAFFRIEDSNIAAQRVHSFSELLEQLNGILQGATRSILAKAEIDHILEERAKFGEMFTEAVNEQLKAWGVTNVKNIELMDIRDSQSSSAIANIMAKKKSLIERESRIAVAENIRAAQEAEIVAQREVLMRKQEAEQQVGQRTAEKDKQVGIANQQAQQEIKSQEKVTAEKHMMVVQVQQVRQAEISRDVQLVNAEQEKRTTVIKAEGVKQVDIVKAEGTKQQTVLVAEGNLEQAKLHAQGVEVEGKARGAAEQAVLMAPVNSQIALAKEIGQNQGYQTYLVTIRTVEKDQAVGIEQAKALAEADIKVIANTGDAISGVSNVMDLFTSKGGTQLGAMAEAFAQSPAGAALLKKINGKGDEAKNVR